MSRVRRKENKKVNKKKFGLFILVMAALIILGGNFINQIRADGNDDGGRGGFGFPNPFGNKNERINILVMGVDAADKNASTRGRADSIMLVSMDSSGNNPAIVSIPRDTRVEIPGRRSLDKINHAHAYGGADLLVETVENLFEIKIHHYVRINYQAVEELVDALGGVEVDVPINMRYSDNADNLHINIPKGVQTLDGKNAVHFLRFRKGYANQDLGRIQAQQNFVTALKDKVLSPSSITKIPQLIDIFYRNVNTNIPKSQMLSMGSKAAGLANEEIAKVTLSGRPQTIGGVSYMIYDEADVKKIRNTYLLDEKDIVPEIEVLNGSGVAGMAQKYKDLLEKDKFIVQGIGNHATSNVEESYIEYNSRFEKKAKEVAKTLGISDVIKLEEENQNIDIRVIVGRDLAQ
ncbi:LCP family protein [Alkaliphilus transvaalensis]|uniref:LCP family protein n=1 Tax=Alkaliphilus transvaalensis TaxID=114628 RepID=UPI000AC86955|nr:LCP family protein [Alkaliphilus transvaalensis]